MFTLVYVMFVHWVADFVLQTHEQASRKSHDNRALGVHVCTYSTVMALGVMPLCISNYADLWHAAGVNGAFYVITFVTHFMTDYCTSRVSSRYFKAVFEAAVEKRPSAGQWWHTFFEIIGLDQWIHLVTVTCTLVALGLGRA